MFGKVAPPDSLVLLGKAVARRRVGPDRRFQRADRLVHPAFVPPADSQPEGKVDCPGDSQPVADQPKDAEVAQTVDQLGGVVFLGQVDLGRVAAGFAGSTD